MREHARKEAEWKDRHHKWYQHWQHHASQGNGTNTTPRATPPQGTTSTKTSPGGMTTTSTRKHHHTAQKARVEVTLPHANAQVTLNGAQTQSTGRHRVYTTPTLQSGKHYSYRVVATWNHNGQQVRAERTVRLTAGTTAHLHFHGGQNSSGQAGQPGQSAGVPSPLNAGQATSVLSQNPSGQTSSSGTASSDE
jgi:uncharacterized protein (TIGR03000 family)